MKPEILSTQETVRLCELERIIQKGKDTFVEVGTALSEIRDSKIYRATFKTFEEYCEKRWAFNRDYASKMIMAAEVVGNLSTMVDKPANERQARPLAKLPAEKQPEAWKKAQDKAKDEGKPIAARHVESAVAEMIEPEPLVVDGSKDQKQEFKAPRKIIESEGMRIWIIAKGQLDRIGKHDEYREQSLNECIKYCQKRISDKK